jgi:hypothetical protein
MFSFMRCDNQLLSDHYYHTVGRDRLSLANFHGLPNFGIRTVGPVPESSESTPIRHKISTIAQIALSIGSGIGANNLMTYKASQTIPRSAKACINGSGPGGIGPTACAPIAMKGVFPP